jgi:rhomboid protease GluP
MPSPFHLACIFLALGGAFAAGVTPQGSAQPRRRMIPLATLLMLALLGAAFAAQLAWPGLLPLVRRDEDLWRRFEIWRVLTALFFQDGSVSGFAFNATILLAVGTASEQRLGSARWPIVYLGAGMLTEMLAVAWQPQGAGNSVAVYGLAGALTVLGPPGRAGVVQLGFRLVAAGAGAGLLVMHDIHGIGFWAGAAIAIALSVQERHGAAARRAGGSPSPSE